MAKVKFFSQKMIDDWVAQNKCAFDGTTLSVLVGDQSAYVLSPATRFIEPIEGDDTHKLSRKVLTEDHIKKLKADVYLDSALVGDVAYKVEPGFVVTGQAETKEAPQTEEKPKESDQLADLMLKALTE